MRTKWYKYDDGNYNVCKSLTSEDYRRAYRVDETKKSYVDLEKCLRVWQKLYLLDDDLANCRANDIDYYFCSNVLNTTVMTVRIIKKYHKLFEAMRIIYSHSWGGCYDYNEDIVEQNLKNIHEAGINFTIE